MAGKQVVLFLRGLNVGGRHKVSMADLRDVLDDLGLGPSSTHLQSGNAVICGRPGPKTDKMVAEALAAEFEFDVPAVSRSAADLAAVVEANPFADQAEADPQSVHVLFLFDRPKANLIDAVGPDRWPDAAWEVVRSRLQDDPPGHRPLLDELGWPGLEDLYRRRLRLYAAAADFRLAIGNRSADDLARTAMLRGLLWERRRGEEST